MNVEFGKRLRSLLIEQNIKQKDLAAVIGVSPSAVGQWIRGGDIDYANLRKVAAFLKVNWVWLRYGEEAMQSLGMSEQTENDRLNAMRQREIRERLENEVRLRRALEAADIDAWEWDVLTDSLRTIRSAHSAIGDDSGTLKDFSDLVIAEDLPKLDMAIVEVIKSTPDNPYNLIVNVRVRQSAGRERILSLKGATYYEYGRPVKVAGVTIDITDYLLGNVS